MALVLSNQTPTREKWIARFHTHNTRCAAILSLIAFDKYLTNTKITEEDLIRKMVSEDEERYFVLDDLVQYWSSQKLSPATIRQYFTFIRSYMRQNRVKTTSEDVKDYVSFPKRIHERRRPLTREQVQTMLKFSNARMSALFLVLLSSGMRVSEALNLRIRDVKFNCDPVRITIPAGITKARQERETFMSKEARMALEPFINQKKEDDLLFPLSLINVERFMQRLREKTGLREKYSNGRNYHVNIHALRAFFHTAATHLHGVEYAHAMLGHGSYLQQYFRMTDDERVSKYRQLEPELTIYDDKVAKAEVAVLKERLSTVDTIKRQQDMIVRFLEAHPQFSKEFERFNK